MSQPRDEDDEGDEDDAPRKPAQKHVAYITAEGFAALKAEHDELWLVE